MAKAYTLACLALCLVFLGCIRPDPGPKTTVVPRASITGTVNGQSWADAADSSRFFERYDAYYDSDFRAVLRKPAPNAPELTLKLWQYRPNYNGTYTLPGDGQLYLYSTGWGAPQADSGTITLSNYQPGPRTVDVTINAKGPGLQVDLQIKNLSRVYLGY